MVVFQKLLTQVFPERITGIMEDVKPNKEFSSGATIPTTPIGSKIVKLKWEDATGLTDPNMELILSGQISKINNPINAVIDF